MRVPLECTTRQRKDIVLPKLMRVTLEGSSLGTAKNLVSAISRGLFAEKRCPQLLKRKEFECP